MDSAKCMCDATFFDHLMRRHIAKSPIFRGFSGIIDQFDKLPRGQICIRRRAKDLDHIRLTTSLAMTNPHEITRRVNDSLISGDCQ